MLFTGFGAVELVMRMCITRDTSHAGMRTRPASRVPSSLDLGGAASPHVLGVHGAVAGWGEGRYG